MPTIDREDLILAAINATGPRLDIDYVDDDGEVASRLETDAEWQSRVTATAINVSLMLRDGSAVSRALDRLDEAETFVANILGGSLERSSKRVIVELETKPTKNSDGRETIRTDRSDTPEGAAMIAKVKSLKNRRVLIWKVNEKFSDDSGRTTRVLVHVEDLGKARSF